LHLAASASRYRCTNPLSPTRYGATCEHDWQPGKTRQQILDAYVAQYGTRVLAEPPATGVNVALYVTPVAVFLASLALVVLVLRRFNRHPTPALPEGGQPRPPIGSPADEARLDDELRDLD